MKLVLSTLLVVAVLAAAASAQFSPGDYVAPVSTGSNTGALLAITPAGVVTSVFKVPFTPTAVTMASDNIDLLVIGNTSTFTTGILVLVSPSGQVTTLTTVSSGKGIFENVVQDQNGTYLVPIGVGMINIVRVDSIGNVTTIVPKTQAGFGKPRGIAVDVDTGDFLVGEIPTLYRIAHDGTSATVASNIQINNGIDMLGDPRTGEVVISEQNQLVSIDTYTGTKTVIKGGFSGCFPGLAYDRANDQWVMSGSCASANSFIYQVDRLGNVNTVVGFGGPADLEIYGSRNILATSDPLPGAAFPLTFSEPSSGNAFYVAAASFLSRPGILLAGQTIDLAPDALFTLSQLAPSVFVNFQGTLDGAGTASASINIPAGPLKGLRFFVSFVTLKGTTIRVANTQGFTIR